MQKSSSLQGSKMKQNYPKQTIPLMATYFLDSSQSRFHRLQRQTHQSYITNKHDYSSKHWVWFLMLVKLYTEAKFSIIFYVTVNYACTLLTEIHTQH